jgi:hypothetical protein
MNQIPGSLRWVLALVLSMLGTALMAHSLPGSTLTFRADQETLGLSVTMPLHELRIAMQGEHSFEANPVNGPVSDGALNQLEAYVADHLILTDAAGEPVALRLSAAWIETVSDDHVGEYSLLVMELTGPAPVFPLTFRYDAIMHEVRNHVAEVYLHAPGAEPVGIGLIRLDPIKSKTRELTISPIP